MNIRKSIYTLSDSQLAAFQAAVNAIKADGSYDDFIHRHHHAMMQATPWQSEAPNTALRNSAHRGPAFLPWHRYFLREFEKALQRKNPYVTLPYWDWTVDAGNPRGAALWNTGPGRQYVGGDGLVTSGPFANWTALVDSGGALIPRPGGIRRQLGADTRGNPAFPTAAQVQDALQNFPEYDTERWDVQSTGSFRNRLEGWTATGSESGSQLHNRVHIWIGGDMGPGTSPNDPVFFLHHGNIDRIWAQWQQRPGSSGYLPVSGGPAGHNLGDQMAHLTSPDPTPARSLDYRRSLGYVYDTDPPLADLATPVVEFHDVPTLETSWRAAVFQVRSPRPVTFEVVPGGEPGAPYSLTSLGGTVTHTPPVDNAPFDPVRIWFAFTGEAAPGVAAEGTAQVRCVETNETFTVTLRGNTVPRPTTGVVLCLDRSGSMEEPAGTGSSRIALLKEAASRCVELTRDGSGIGVVSFDHNATPEIDLAPFGPASTQRADALNAIGGLSPGGATSIGGGVELARQKLQAGDGAFDGRAILVMTDGLENEPPFLGDVMGSIDQRSFAIGLGTAQQVSTEALGKLANNTDGYLLLTGPLGSDLDSYFRLSKYFQQILISATNENVVTDPAGFIRSGEEGRIPFQLSEADIDATVILMVDVPAVRLQIETPGGEVLDESALEEVGAQVVHGSDMTYVRLGLPSVNGAHGGTWQAVLKVDGRRFRSALSALKKQGEEGAVLAELAAEQGARYNVTVSSWSNVRMTVRLLQKSLEPGADVGIKATLTEYALPVEGAEVFAEVAPPDGRTRRVRLEEVGNGEYLGSFNGEYPGAWRIHVLAAGAGRGGTPFTREQLLSAGIVDGAERVAPPRLNAGRELTEALRSLLGEKGPRQALERAGVDPDQAIEILERHGKPSPERREEMG
jgi:hypothetical protein